jgi:hypothetical protein
MRNVKIFFDGILQNSDDFRGLKNAGFTYRSKDENGENGFSFSPELNIYNSAFNYVKTNIIDKPIPQLEQIKVRILDECCSDLSGNPIELMTGKIDGADVEWCELPCNDATVSIVDDSDDSRAIVCLKNTQIWDRKPKFDGSGNSLGEDTHRTAPYTSYCHDVKPAFLQEVVLIFGLLFIIAIAPTLFVIAALVTAVNVIISIVGGTPIGGDISFFDDANDLINFLTQIITGCGYKHKTPFIHSYLQNLCDICGLTLQSSYFEVGKPYHNTMRLDAQYVPGGRSISKILRNYEKNKPNLNGIQFLDEFKQLNMDWRVSGGALILERKDYDFGGLWFDLSTFNQEDIIELCFSVTDEKPPAYGEYNYSKDGVDNAGDEVKEGWSELVFDWNNPPSPAQSGLKSVNLFYSMTLFRRDVNREDVAPIDKAFYNAIYPALSDFEGAMLMEKGVCGFPKLLQWDGVSPQDNARVLRFPGDPSDPTYAYNVDWWIRENFVDGGGTPRDTLYQRLFFIDNPRETGIKTRRFTLRIVANCELIRTISPDKIIRIPVSGVYKDAKIEEIEFNTDSYQFTIQGLV